MHIFFYCSKLEENVISFIISASVLLIYRYDNQIREYNQLIGFKWPKLSRSHDIEEVCCETKLFI